MTDNMRRNLLILILCCGALALAACARDEGGKAGGANVTNGARVGAGAPTASGGTVNAAETKKAPGDDVVRASAGEVRLAAGGAGEAVVRLDIAEGFHVNANPPSDRFYIGTELSVAAADGVTPGKPIYPRALMLKFQFAEKQLAVYERAADIKLPLSADRAATKGAHTLPAKIRVQPCNDQECFPPRTVETPIRVTVE